MKKVLFIVNKHVTGERSQKYYIYFLNYLIKYFSDYNLDLKILFFSDHFKKKITDSSDILFYTNDEDSLNNAVIDYDRINKIEKEYNFTFMQAIYPEMLQSGPYTIKKDYRGIYIPEEETSDLRHLLPRFEYLEDLIMNQGIDIILSDQSTDAEIEFARAICYKYKKVFLRIWPDFLGKRTIHQEFKFGEETIVQAVNDPNFSYEMAKLYLEDYLKNKRLPYQHEQEFVEDISLKNRIKNKIYKESLIEVVFAIFNKVKSKTIFFIKKIFYIYERIRKKRLYEKYDDKKNYLFWGFHLATEATIAKRGLPFMTQTSLIESISRVLPSNHLLYVREHPLWRDAFPYYMVKRLSKLPNVRLISTEISIHTILKNSKGVITYNATTGIEALMHGIPVLSFSPNVYYPLHPAASHCTNLYQLSSKLIKLINTKVDQNETIEYLKKMFQISNDIPMEAEKFFSVEDSKIKAKKLSYHLNEAIKIFDAD